MPAGSAGRSEDVVSPLLGELLDLTLLLGTLAFCAVLALNLWGPR